MYFIIFYFCGFFTLTNTCLMSPIFPKVCLWTLETTTLCWIIPIFALSMNMLDQRTKKKAREILLVVFSWIFYRVFFYKYCNFNFVFLCYSTISTLYWSIFYVLIIYSCNLFSSGKVKDLLNLKKTNYDLTGCQRTGSHFPSITWLDCRVSFGQQIHDRQWSWS